MTDTDRICQLEEELAVERERNETQADTIKSLWVEIAAIKKRDEHAQAYIPKLKAENAKLERQLSPIGQAEQVFKGAGQ